jgi:hypothetical protein
LQRYAERFILIKMDARPPFDPAKPVEGFLRISAGGQWLYQGEPITHPGLISILESNFARDEEGRYLVYLKLPMGTQKVNVEFDDTPYFVREVRETALGIELLLNDSSRETLEAKNVFLGLSNGHTYVKVKGGEWAKFSRKSELELSSKVEERNGEIGLTLQGRWESLGTRQDR